MLVKRVKPHVKYIYTNHSVGLWSHVERMSDERMAKKIYDGKVSGKRGRGDLG